MECDVVKLNMGKTRCNKMPEMLVGMIETPSNFVIPAATLNDPVALLEFLNDAAVAPAAERIYLWPEFKSFENISQEAVYEDTPLAYLPVRDGNYRFKIGIRQNMCTHKAMYTHRASSGRVIFIDSENQLILTEAANGDGMGLSMQLLHTEKLLFNDGSISTKSMFVVALQNNKELDRNGMLTVLDSWNQITQLVDVKLRLIGTPTATTIVVDAAPECDSSTPLPGLVVADFSLIDNATGTAHTITTAVEDPLVPGRYTLTGVAYVASKLKLAAAEDLSLPGYETPEAVAVNPA